MRAIITVLLAVSIGGTLAAQPAQAPGGQTFPVNDSGTGAFRPGNNGIVGTVRDADGNVMPNAIVILRNLRTTVAERAVTDDRGAFVFRVLDPGTYVIEVVTVEGTVTA